MKIYTRTGDNGTTALFGGDRVLKSHPRIAAYGTVDELNAFLGQALVFSKEERLSHVLVRLQHELFVLGGDLATPTDSRASVPRITTQHIAQLEQDIDAFEADLSPLRQFILPGGAPTAAQLHIARTVCRRAERHVVEATQATSLSDTNLHYLNRLSDLLFVLARWANLRAGKSDVTWEQSQEETKA